MDQVVTLNFDISKFSVKHQRVLRRLEQLFHLTRDGFINKGATSSYRYALIKPTSFVQSLLHTDREVALLFSDYNEFQPRTIDAYDQIFRDSDEFRVEKVVRILVSDDPEIAEKITDIFSAQPDAPVVIPFHSEELNPSSKDEFIFERFRKFTFARDLFSMSSPLRSESYFYGRSSLVKEICSKMSVGENFGLFGLRRSGKTSIVHGVNRALPTRSGNSTIIDCSSPSIHKRRWNELLHYIVQQIKEENSVDTKIHKEVAYTEKDAASLFIKDIRSLKSRIGGKFLVLLFDEIERICFDTASSEHWKVGRDFLDFWQAVRSGFQTSPVPYTFLIVGTNPSAVERVKLFESDNPLFGNVEKRFMPMFDDTQISEMVLDLGKIMGVEFNAASLNRLSEDFGGHPFLTRYACSHIADQMKNRPLMVDRTVYAMGVNKFKTESHEYVRAVVGLLEENYPEEHEMLKYLASDLTSFNVMAKTYPSLVEHLIGYGIVGIGEMSHFFKIGIVQGFFVQEARPTQSLSFESRRTEISEGRNRIEQDLRSTIKKVFEISFAKKNRSGELLKAVPAERREKLQQMPFDVLLSQEESPLFLLDLRGIIDKNWTLFEIF